MIIQQNNLNSLVAKKIFSDPTPSPRNFSSDINCACDAIYKVVNEYNRMAYLKIKVDDGELVVKICYMTGTPICEVKVTPETSLSEAMCLCALGAKK